MWRYAVLFLLAVGCTQDPYERAAECEALIEEATSCAEWLPRAELIEMDVPAVTQLWAKRLQHVCDVPDSAVSRIPEHVFPIDGGRRFYQTDPDGSNPRDLCPCKVLTLEAWPGPRRRKARMCELFLKDFQAGRGGR